MIILQDIIDLALHYKISFYNLKSEVLNALLLYAIEESPVIVKKEEKPASFLTLFVIKYLGDEKKFYSATDEEKIHYCGEALAEVKKILVQPQINRVLAFLRSTCTYSVSYVSRKVRSHIIEYSFDSLPDLNYVIDLCQYNHLNYSYSIKKEPKTERKIYNLNVRFY